jgi:hypothetical protein
MTRPDPSVWESLEPWQQALAWKDHPEIALKAVECAREELRARRRIELLQNLRPLAPSVFGVIAVTISAIVSVTFLCFGASVQGAWIFGTTAVALAGTFVAGKVVKTKPAVTPTAG